MLHLASFFLRAHKVAWLFVERFRACSKVQQLMAWKNMLAFLVMYPFMLRHVLYLNIFRMDARVFFLAELHAKLLVQWRLLGA